MNNNYWKKFCGIELYKLDWYLRYFLYKFLRINLPKIRNQRNYWTERGRFYMDEILTSGYLDRERFYQDMLVDELMSVDFRSCLEIGCGFGWNLKRLSQTFHNSTIAGIDFSSTQLENSKIYLRDQKTFVVHGDALSLPFKDKCFDVVFTLGVFMNIHHDFIKGAIQETIRVCKKRIIHIEWDANRTTKRLKERRAFKTNIVSHDYYELYKEMNCNVVKLLTYKDFCEEFYSYQKKLTSIVNRWEGFEGPEKYIFIVIKP